jgi:hypothetical protein
MASLRSRVESAVTTVRERCRHHDLPVGLGERCLTVAAVAPWVELLEGRAAACSSESTHRDWNIADSGCFPAAPPPEARRLSRRPSPMDPKKGSESVSPAGRSAGPCGHRSHAGQF